MGKGLFNARIIGVVTHKMQLHRRIKEIEILVTIKDCSGFLKETGFLVNIKEVALSGRHSSKRGYNVLVQVKLSSNQNRQRKRSRWRFFCFVNDKL